MPPQDYVPHAKAFDNQDYVPHAKAFGNKCFKQYLVLVQKEQWGDFPVQSAFVSAQ